MLLLHSCRGGPCRSRASTGMRPPSEGDVLPLRRDERAGARAASVPARRPSSSCRGAEHRRERRASCDLLTIEFFDARITNLTRLLRKNARTVITNAEAIRTRIGARDDALSCRAVDVELDA